MMKRADEKSLNLLLDGRLSGDEASALKERLAKEPALAAEYEGLRQLRASFEQVFDGAGSAVAPAQAQDPVFEELWAGVSARIGEAVEAPQETATALATPEKAQGFMDWLREALAAPALLKTASLAAAAVVVAVVGFALWAPDGSVDLPGGGAVGGVVTIDESPKAVDETPKLVEEAPKVARAGVRRTLDGEQRAPRMVAVVESYDVSRGVVVVNEPSGSLRHPLVIWHYVEGEGVGALNPGEKL